MGWDSSYSADELFQSQFVKTYRCLPFSKLKNSELHSGNYVIMPPSSLDQLMSMDMEHPWIFQVENYNDPEFNSHCGVLQFDSEEGFIHMPDWMMENLCIQEGDLVIVRNASLQKGTYMKLQPHETCFVELSHPKAVLERTLRNFPCVSSGDTILLKYNGKDFHFNVIETKPGNAICLIDTDCEVEFETPLHYVKADEKLPPPAAEEEGMEKRKKLAGDEEKGDAEKNKKFKAFAGKARRLDAEPTTSIAAVEKDLVSPVTVAKKSSDKDGGKEKFKPFTGKSYVLGN